MRSFVSIGLLGLLTAGTATSWKQVEVEEVVEREGGLPFAHKCTPKQSLSKWDEQLYWGLNVGTCFDSLSCLCCSDLGAN